MVEIRPQEGAQEAFLSSQADITIYGGAAGGGKTFGLIIEPLRHIHNPKFGAVTFRRNSKQVRNEGGLWDEAGAIYPLVGGVPNQTDLSFKFSSGAKVSYAHLEHDNSVYSWQGSQIPLIMFDELTHFSAAQFWYMVSRNRSTCGVRPYIRATCNPDPDSFVARLIEWWLDDSGYPIRERSGVLRWFIRLGDKLIWADSPEGLKQYQDGQGESIPPKSLTFIPSKLSDNKILMASDPAYLGALMALPEVERARLLDGNWKIKNTKARVFSKVSVQSFETPPDALFRFGADWGFANDPTVLIKSFIVGRTLYIRNCVAGVGIDILDTPAFFDKIPDARKWSIVADSARPETISHMRRMGFKIRPAIKGAGSIDDGIEWLKTFDIVIHPDCDNLLEQEMRNYSYKVDKVSGDILPILEDKYNNTIDALRYSCEAVRKAVRPPIIPKSLNPPDLWSQKNRDTADSWKTM
jgi:hypothetical protein